MQLSRTETEHFGPARWAFALRCGLLERVLVVPPFGRFLVGNLARCDALHHRTPRLTGAHALTNIVTAAKLVCIGRDLENVQMRRAHALLLLNCARTDRPDGDVIGHPNRVRYARWSIHRSHHVPLADGIVLDEAHIARHATPLGQTIRVSIAHHLDRVATLNKSAE